MFLLRLLTHNTKKMVLHPVIEAASSDDTTPVRVTQRTLDPADLGGAYELVNAASHEIRFLGSEMVHLGSVLEFNGDTTRRDITGDRASPSCLSAAWKVLLIPQHFGLPCERDRVAHELSCN